MTAAVLGTAVAVVAVEAGVPRPVTRPDMAASLTLPRIQLGPPVQPGPDQSPAANLVAGAATDAATSSSPTTTAVTAGPGTPTPAKTGLATEQPASPRQTTPQPAGTPPRQLIVPDLIAALPTGITSAQLAQIARLSGVRGVLPVSGGEIMVNGKPANVIGVAPQAFRSWTPPRTAANVAAWTGLSGGALLASRASVTRLGLAKAGAAYKVTGATAQDTPLGAAADLGLPGVDAVVNAQRSAQLGLIKNVAVLINAPGDDLVTLMSQVRKVLGSLGQVRNLVTVVVVTKLPVTTFQLPAGQVPSNWMQLYQDSAQRYCPGLSWTVLAAIGEIESGDGANDGPSTAGALGPMQFMPGTWSIWGMNGFDQTGTPDIMNPYDAVPSAARMLCADGAVDGGPGLSRAIFDYNHADWYVNEVLALANEYAQAYP
jgi:Transglycosylase SLT domain